MNKMKIFRGLLGLTMLYSTALSHAQTSGTYNSKPGMVEKMRIIMTLATLPKTTTLSYSNKRIKEAIRAKLNPNPTRTGMYGMGEKLSLQQAMDARSGLGQKKLKLLEIDTIIITPVDTRLVNIERIAKKNTETMIEAYPGRIKCNSDRICKSRRKVARHLFRNVMEVYETLHSTLKAICVTKENTLPYSVIVANSAANRSLDDAAGFLEVGYIPSGIRLQNKLRGAQDVYIKTKDALNHYHMRAKRNPLMVTSMIGMGIVQIGTAIGTAHIAADVSALSGRLEIMEKKVNLNAKETQSIMRRMSTDIQFNSLFDQVGQIMEMIRQDGRELTKIARSMTKGMIDAASEREGARIISRIAAPLSPLLPRTKVQELITTMSMAQGSKIDIIFPKGSRRCSETTRRVSFITPQPLIKGANSYVEEEEGTFTSTSSKEKGTKFLVNPYNMFKTEFDHLGKHIKFVSRTIQVWKSVRIKFVDNPNQLEDHFIITLDMDLEIDLFTKCGKEEAKERKIFNNTHISIPLQCAAYTPEKIFLRSMTIRREAKSELGNDLVDREAESPRLTIKIHERPVEDRVNQYIANWNENKENIQKESNSPTYSRGGLPSWEKLIIIGGSTGATIILVLIIGGTIYALKAGK